MAAPRAAGSAPVPALAAGLVIARPVEAGRGDGSLLSPFMPASPRGQGANLPGKDDMARAP